MITIINRQKKVVVSTKKVYSDTEKIVNFLGYHEWDVGILITTNRTIAHYNKKYRDKTGPTDILSFPFHDPIIKPGSIPIPIDPHEKNLGDLILSAEYIYAQVKDYPAFEKKLQELLVHGICHLLGYDHVKDSDYRVMRKKEIRLLALLNP